MGKRFKTISLIDALNCKQSFISEAREKGFVFASRNDAYCVEQREQSVVGTKKPV